MVHRIKFLLLVVVLVFSVSTSALSLKQSLDNDEAASKISGSRAEDEPPKIPVPTQGAEADACKQGPMKAGTLIECDAYIPKYTFSIEKGTCEGFIYGGCGGSENLFDTRAECESRCSSYIKRHQRK